MYGERRKMRENARASGNSVLLSRDFSRLPQMESLLAGKGQDLQSSSNLMTIYNMGSC